jgi:type I restriction-modification system DNA methylase subunit
MLWQKKKKRKKATKPKAVTLVAPQQPVEEIPQTTEPEKKEETPKQKKPVGKKSKEVFPELAAQTVLALEENPEQDFLGSIFMSLKLGDEYNGQIFTPYHVCELMAEMTMDDTVKKVEQDGYISINDPCCGAGATLIAGIHAARKQLEKANLNHQNHLLVVAQDIDETVALMCYIQLSLLGVAGYVKVGNSLTEPMTDNDDKENYWFTPMYFSNVWVLRRIFGGR